MNYENHTFLNYLQEMSDKRRNALIDIYEDYKHLFHKAKGSTFNHQAWDGGYADHLAECFMINNTVYKALSTIRPLPFTKDSAAVALFFHDIEKPFKNINSDDKNVLFWQNHQETSLKSWESIKFDILNHMQETYKFALNDDEINALLYTHGEGSDHQKTKRVMSPLAAHVHHCDNTSARIWHNFAQQNI